MDTNKFFRRAGMKPGSGLGIKVLFQRGLGFIGDEMPALVSGLLLTLSFPKSGCSWMAFFALIPLLVSLAERSGRAAFRAGVAAGLVHFITLIYWIVPTIHDYGGVPLVLAVPALLLLGFYLALYPGIFAWGVAGWGKGRGHSLWFPLKAAVLWAALEYLRALLLTGLPWGLLGHTQYLNLYLIQLADITGVYGISFALVFTNGAGAQVWRALLGRYKKEPEASMGFPGASLALLALVWAGIAIYGDLRLESVASETAKAPGYRISVLQGNIGQSEKWDKTFQEKTVETYCGLTRAAAQDSPALIVWPETALPFYYTWDRELSNLVDGCVRRSGTSALIGSPAFESPGEELLYYNRAYMVDRLGSVMGTYDKVHLVPFGEYVPLGRFLVFLGKIIAQAGDFSPGSGDAPPLVFDRGRAGVLICFEVIFPDLARRAVENGANILVTITNDAWFGTTSAPMQHFSQAVFRAVETRRSVVRAANTGISGFIDPAGRIIGATALNVRVHLTRSVPLLDGKDFYLRHGDLFAIICLILSLCHIATRVRNVINRG